MMTQWMIVVAGPQYIGDIRQASDDQLSVKDAMAELISYIILFGLHAYWNQTLHADILFGPELLDDDFHIEVIRSHLTRNITSRFSDVQEEIAVAFSEYMPTKGEMVGVNKTYSEIIVDQGQNGQRLLRARPF
jgi:hypothetical protein